MSVTTGSGHGVRTDAESAERIPYRGEQPYAVPDDLVVLGALDIDAADDRLWVPQSEHVTFRPLLLSVSQGYFVNILRVRRSGILSRHRHAGPVHALTLRGRWHYLEHEWWAEQGGYSYEPPGDIHTLEVPDGVPVGVEDVFTKIAKAREHYAAVGLGADHVDRFIR